MFTSKTGMINIYLTRSNDCLWNDKKNKTSKKSFLRSAVAIRQYKYRNITFSHSVHFIWSYFIKKGNKNVYNIDTFCYINILDYLSQGEYKFQIYSHTAHKHIDKQNVYILTCSITYLEKKTFSSGILEK